MQEQVDDELRGVYWRRVSRVLLDGSGRRRVGGRWGKGRGRGRDLRVEVGWVELLDDVGRELSVTCLR